MNRQTEKGEVFFSRLPVVIVLALLCCLLWGSAFPSVKTGYALFQISADDSASQLVFAGARFFLAGLLTLLFGSLGSKKVLLPKRSSLKYVVILALFQTIIQYFFFYLGLAHTGGAKAAILNASPSFFAILIACLLVRMEKMTVGKAIGCILGFAGVILINLGGSGAGFDFQFSLNGEGFILISSLSSGISSVLIKRFSAKEDPVTLSGSQFFLGGLVLMLIGFLRGGRLTFRSPFCVLILLYLAMLSAIAYTIWGILLKYNPVSRVTIFGFMIPVFGALLSALILKEQNQIFTVYGAVSLLLVCSGIVTVNLQKKQRTS